MRPLLLLVQLILLVACTASPPTPQPVAVEPSAAEASPAAVPFSDARVDPADVDAALAYVLSLLDPRDPDAVLDEATFEARFDHRFRSQAPFSQVSQAIATVRELGPFTVTREVSRSAVGELLVRADADDGTEVAISLVVTPQGQISGLLFSPGDPPTLEAPVATLQEAVDQLDARGTLWLSAARVEDGACVTELGVQADQPAPIAAAATLYVLAAVVDGVADGSLTWEDQLVITADVKSLLPGELQDRPDLSTVTVQEAAQLMIAAGDNTAADLLVRTVGRAAVEQAQGRYGHHAPDVNVPFLTTRERFALKAASAAVQQAWVDGDAAARRQVLDDLADADLPDPAPADDDAPNRPLDLQWLASPEDLCRVMTRLLDRAREPDMEPLEAILTTSPGVPDREQRWSRLAFKGGAEPGLLSAVWVVEDADGGRWSLAASLLDADAPLDEVQTILLMGAARDLLGEGPER